MALPQIQSLYSDFLRSRSVSCDEQSENLPESASSYDAQNYISSYQYLMKKAEHFLLMIYDSKNRIVGTGILLDKRGYFITISNIFPIIQDNNFGGKILGTNQLYVKFYNSDAQFNFSHVNLFVEDNLSVCKLDQFDPQQVPDCEEAEINESPQICDKVYLLGKSNHNFNIFSKGVINEINLDFKHKTDYGSNDKYLMATITIHHTSLSGAPLLDKQGRVNGLLLPIQFSFSQFYSLYHKVEVIKNIQEQIKATNYVRKPYFGMQIETLEKNNGVKINQLTPDGPAMKAGLKLGWQIINIDDYKVIDAKDFNKRLGFKLKKQFKIGAIIDANKKIYKEFMVDSE